MQTKRNMYDRKEKKIEILKNMALKWDWGYVENFMSDFLPKISVE